MKIGIVAWDLNISGGTQRQALELALHLQKMGHNVKVYTVYYDKEECDKFDEAMDRKLTENLFDKLCDIFFELIREAGSIESDEDIFKITVGCWPTLTIFDEISKYPEWAQTRCSED